MTLTITDDHTERMLENPEEWRAIFVSVQARQLILATNYPEGSLMREFCLQTAERAQAAVERWQAVTERKQLGGRLQ